MSRKCTIVNGGCYKRGAGGLYKRYGLNREPYGAFKVLGSVWYCEQEIIVLRCSNGFICGMGYFMVLVSWGTVGV